MSERPNAHYHICTDPTRSDFRGFVPDEAFVFGYYEVPWSEGLKGGTPDELAALVLGYANHVVKQELDRLPESHPARKSFTSVRPDQVVIHFVTGAEINEKGWRDSYLPLPFPDSQANKRFAVAYVRGRIM